MQIKTKRLTLSTAVTDDIPALEEIEKECDEYFIFDPQSAAEQNRSVRECMLNGDIIPGIADENYVKDNYNLLSIRTGGEIIGWLAYYSAYHGKDTAYLSLLYIKKSHRISGFGTEIIDALTLCLAESDHSAIKLHCSLRNALALRFWVKNGFDRITDVECDGNLVQGKFGGLELMKKIT